MNIVFCYITPFHPQRGGVGRVTHSLTCELLKRGHKIYYLIYESGITIKHEYDYPVELSYLPSKELLSKENIEYYHHFLNDKNIDIIINQSGNFSDSRLWLNKGDSKAKTVSVLHTYPSTSLRHLWQCDIYPLRNNTFKEKIKRIARIILYPKIKRDRIRELKKEFHSFLPQSDVVVVLTKKILPELNKVITGYEGKYRVIPNANSYRTDELCSSITKRKQILWVGLFGTLKREDMIAKIWTTLSSDFPDWELVIVGYGDALRTKRLQKIASKYKNIRIVGGQDPLKYQLSASVACMTSISEGWGLVLTEAMQCGAVPIVFDSFAAASEIIQDGENGFLITPFDEKEYADQLRELMTNDSLRNRMAKKAHESVKRFDVEIVADQWEELFYSLLKL